MKLLFVENRYATRIFEAVARQLALSGHEIHWMVQNPIFAPTSGHVHLLPFPPKRPAKLGDNNAPVDYDWLRRTDRGVLHFGVKGDHYAHYDFYITRVLDQVVPDVVFGEPTQFHELLTITRARERGIQYLSPNSTRYPADRLAFYAYDTLKHVGGDGSQLSDTAADEMIDAICTRKLVPSYMRPASHAPKIVDWTQIIDKLRVSAGWLAGEKYITPSPARKLALNSARNQQRQRWEARAAQNPMAWPGLRSSGKPWVLYALQMQPEANIDVWGTPWNDQAETIRRAARALHAQGAVMVVKPNPKSKYEMSAKLNDVLEAEPNIIGLPHATPMAEVFQPAPLVLAITGTVLLECILAGKPVATLGAHHMHTYPGVTPLSAPEGISPLLHDALSGHARVASREESRSLLQNLHTTSYSASMWDPVAQTQLGTPAAVGALVEAFSKVLRELDTPISRTRDDSTTAYPLGTLA